MADDQIKRIKIFIENEREHIKEENLSKEKYKIEEAYHKINESLQRYFNSIIDKLLEAEEGKLKEKFEEKLKKVGKKIPTELIEEINKYEKMITIGRLPKFEISEKEVFKSAIEEIRKICSVSKREIEDVAEISIWKKVFNPFAELTLENWKVEGFIKDRKHQILDKLENNLRILRDRLLNRFDHYRHLIHTKIKEVEDFFDNKAYKEEKEKMKKTEELLLKVEDLLKKL
ncbi:MAG: hypothetical protein ABGX27_01670 [Desulfurobacteriaceae bacterium]